MTAVLPPSLSSPSLSTTTTPSAMQSTTAKVFKGKYTRSWQQLPSEIVRLIATFYITDVCSQSYFPNTWDIRELWPSRMVYGVLRDALELEKMMYFCPAWSVALETHKWWKHALSVIDPLESIAPPAVLQPAGGAAASTEIVFISPYQHFRYITNCSCVVCRINAPFTPSGLGVSRRTINSPLLGHVYVCREHRKASYCGICLREQPRYEGEAEYAQGTSVCCMDNEDDDTWPGVEATCRGCRNEWLWRRVQNNASDREALGGHKWDCPDWETRQSVEAFIDLGEGTIKEVLGLAREKYWLRMNTKLPDMLKQALAASRFVSRAEAGEAYGSDDELSDDEDEEDPELMSITEDAGGVRDIAVNDWARNRILDGCWISPADQWYGYTNQNRSMVVPSHHPCPWNRGSTYAGALEDGETETAGEGELEHPRPKTVRALCPPSFQLCEQVYRAFQRQMKEILLPAMQNVVRKLVIECAADGTDPAIKAAKMTADEVTQELRDPAVWYNGFDWLERRANSRREQERERRSKDEDDASTSSRSDGSHTTSPVLSTTTLQTTPSPPPSAKDDESIASPTTASVPSLPIPVSPVLKSPELLRPIPYIPVAISHLPPFSMEALMTPWREACSPLYHCRCSICERAKLKESLSSGAVVPTQAQLQATPAVEQTARITEDTIAIQIEDETADFAEEEEEDGESEKDDDTSIPDSSAESICEIPPFPLTPRKRPSRELDDAFADAVVEHDRAGSPPKRPRKDGTYSPSTASFSPTPVRTRKRSSEELEEDESKPVQTGNGDAKRPRPSPPHLPRSSAIVQKSKVALSVVDGAN